MASKWLKMVKKASKHGEKAGIASALMGALQFMTATVMIAITGMFFDGTPVPMIAAIAACSTIAFLLAMISVPRRPVAVTVE